MPEISYQITHSPDYPCADGLHHAYFAHIMVDGNPYSQYNLISSHLAAGCLIDHESRIVDVEIPEEITLMAQRLVWRMVQE